MNKITALFIIILIAVSCNVNQQDSFYSDYETGDLYRVPLFAPYELTQLYGIKQGEGPTDDWNLDFKFGGDPQSPGFGHGTMVSEVNVDKGIIYGHSVKTNDYPDVWFVIIPGEKVEKVFKDKKNEWIAYLQKRNIDWQKLFAVWPVFDEFKKSKRLPWHTP